MTWASLAGWPAPTDAHDIDTALKNRFGQSCCKYRALEGDTGETHGGHWCGLAVFGNLTYCAILPPTFGTKARSPLKLRRSTVQNTKLAAAAHKKTAGGLRFILP